MMDQVEQTNVQSPRLENKKTYKPVERNEKYWLDCLKDELKIDPKFLPHKVFYLVFYAGFGLFPYLPLYFKQLGLSASLVGMLVGIRPIIQFIAGPFWSLLADRFQAHKIILLLSIVAWLVMTLALLLPVPQRTYCKEIKLGNYSIQNISSDDSSQARERTRSLLRNAAKKSAFSEAGSSAEEPEFRLVSDQPKKTLLEDIHSRYEKTGRKEGNISSAYYLLIRDERELKSVFVWLLLLIVTGEFLEVPSFILTDTSLLQKLGDKTKDYGKTRLFGSIGFAASSFAMGGLVDTTQYMYCGQLMNNYNVVFYLFASVMAVGFVLAAWMFKFNYDNDDMEDSNERKANTASILKVFLQFNYAFYITITWFLGFNHGLLFNFLNWYLEDLGASKLLMGTGILCRAVTLTLAFFFHGCLGDIFGPLALIFWTLASYVMLFSCFSVIINPWWAIPLELYHGLVFGTSWSTLVVYMANATQKSGAATMQGILQSVYWGLGGGIGSIIGGIMIDKYGAASSFLIGGVMSGAVLVASAIVQFCVWKIDHRRSSTTLSGEG